jgi:hypothetical protein
LKACTESNSDIRMLDVRSEDAGDWSDCFNA